MSITAEEKLQDRMIRAYHLRKQLDAVAIDMCLIMDVDSGTAAGRLLRSAAYGEIKLNYALRQLVNLKLAELATIEVEFVK